MNLPLFNSSTPITLVGGGDATLAELAMAQSYAPQVVAADGGATFCLAAGARPKAVIGDLDSLNAATRQALPASSIHHIPEQDSTDFDKALRSVEAPLIIGVGFLGRRIDHELSVLNRLAVRSDRKVILIGAHDVTFLCPPEIALPLKPGIRVSLFPMAPVTGRSDGLRWPIAGLKFAPGGQVGTSNEALGPIHLQTDTPGLLVILPKDAFNLTVEALLKAAAWPARAR